MPHNRNLARRYAVVGDQFARWCDGWLQSETIVGRWCVVRYPGEKPFILEYEKWQKLPVARPEQATEPEQILHPLWEEKEPDETIRLAADRWFQSEFPHQSFEADREFFARNWRANPRMRIEVESVLIESAANR